MSIRTPGPSDEFPNQRKNTNTNGPQLSNPQSTVQSNRTEKMQERPSGQQGIPVGNQRRLVPGSYQEIPVRQQGVSVRQQGVSVRYYHHQGRSVPVRYGVRPMSYQRPVGVSPQVIPVIYPRPVGVSPQVIPVIYQRPVGVSPQVIPVIYQRPVGVSPQVIPVIYHTREMNMQITQMSPEETPRIPKLISVGTDTQFSPLGPLEIQVDRQMDHPEKQMDHPESQVDEEGTADHRQVSQSGNNSTQVRRSPEKPLNPVVQQNTLQNKPELNTVLQKMLTQHKSPEEPKVKDPFFHRHNELLAEFDCGSDTEEQLKIFMNKITMTFEDIHKRKIFMEELSSVIRVTYHKCVLCPFGSFVTNIGDRDSDVDIFVDVTGELLDRRGNAHTKAEKMEIFQKVLKAIRRNGYLYSSVIPIAQARVPIITLCHRSLGIKADLSFENLLSVQNSKLIAFYIGLDTRVRPLLLIVRYWARFHGLSGSNLVKNYGIVLLVLVFLMQKKIIPNVHTLQTLAPQPIMIEYWNASFCKDVELIKNSSVNQQVEVPVFALNEDNHPIYTTHLCLAEEFFDTMANLNFETLIICPLLGVFDLPRKLFSPEFDGQLQPEFERYQTWTSSSQVHGPPEQRNQFDIKSPLCIQDPFQLGYNVGGCTKDLTLYKFRAACVGASSQITKILAASFPNLLDTFLPLAPHIGKKPKRRIKNFNPFLTVVPCVDENVKKPRVEKLEFTPTLEYEQLFQSLTQNFTPPSGYLESLSCQLWSTWMVDFLKSVLNQAYKVQVKIDEFSATLVDDSQNNMDDLAKDNNGNVEFQIADLTGKDQIRPIKRPLASTSGSENESPNKEKFGQSAHKFLKAASVTQVETELNGSDSITTTAYHASTSDDCEIIFADGTETDNLNTNLNENKINKTEEISLIVNKLFMVHCTGTILCWEGRKKLRKRNPKLFKSESPLLAEGKLTDIYLNKFGNNPPTSPIFQFDMEVFSEPKEGKPILRALFTEVFGCKFTKEALHYFTTPILSGLAFEYLKYRLNTWFLHEGGREHIIAASVPKESTPL